MPATRTQLQAALVAATQDCQPASPQEIAAELGKLSLHYWRPDFNEAQAKQLYSDYIKDLQFPLGVLQSAIGSYRRNPKSKWYPKVGELVALCEPLYASRLADRKAIEKRLVPDEEDTLPSPERRKEMAEEMRRVARGLKA